MKKNQKEINIKSLIKNFSIETTPNVYNKYGNFAQFLNHKNSVYVTYLPDEKLERVIDTSKKLKEEGFRVVPHLPARTFKNNSHLEKYIGKLSEIAGCDNILVIGGGEETEEYIRLLSKDYHFKVCHRYPIDVLNYMFYS